jgi:hypothetical protein
MHLQIVIAVYMLWNIMGPSVLAGLAVMILLIPINGVLASMQRKLQANYIESSYQTESHITIGSFCRFSK